MKGSLRFILVLLFALGLLATAASILMQRTTREWFERDVRLRAELAVSGASEALASHWRKSGRRELQKVLIELARDERLLSVAACDADLTPLTATPGFPGEFSCRRFGERVRPAADAAAPAWTGFHSAFTLPSGRVLVSALPLREEDPPPGFVVLVHDLSYVERREAEGWTFLMLVFGLLTLIAAAVTLVAVRLSWRGWSNELRRLLRGESEERPEFGPVLREMRELYDRILEQEGGSWTPQRLRDTLKRHLHGERIVIVANREPYIHVREADGSIAVRHPASGLVTALEPVMRACSGVWVAHGGGSADRETADAKGRLRVPPGDESYTLRRVWLTQEEERGYYYGFANEGLWPLCHLAHARPIFRGEDWTHYKEVNARFAAAVCEEVDTEDPIILVQDYHFALAPRLIRQRLPRATIITFWHIPWPNAEHFGICPWRDEILEGMLGSSILGFHTQLHCNNFFDAADRYLESRIDRDHNAVVQHGRRTLVRPYPISVEWPIHWVADLPPVEECRAGVRAELGLPPEAFIGLGVDRLDYTKGIEERFMAVERLIEQRPEYRGRFSFVQLAAPSRAEIQRYKDLHEAVIRLAERINGRFGSGDWRPIVFRREHYEPPDIFRFYRAADVCYVSSLHDGMNLVAKEFIAARDDEHGVLMLSQFTGAARELDEALIVNPYDLDQAGAALATAIEMPREEQRARMHAMRAHVAEFNIYRWAGRMLIDAARLRQRERVSVRIEEQA